MFIHKEKSCWVDDRGTRMIVQGDKGLPREWEDGDGGSICHTLQEFVFYTYTFILYSFTKWKQVGTKPETVLCERQKGTKG